MTSSSTHCNAWSFFSFHYDDAVVVNVAAAAGVAAFKGGMGVVVVFIVRNGAVLLLFDINVTLTLQWRSFGILAGDVGTRLERQQQDGSQAIQNRSMYPQDEARA